jgi:hypothetical protein
MNAARLLKLGMLALATVCLAVAAWMARDSLQRLADERRQVAISHARHTAALQLLPQLERRDQFVQQTRALQAQAQRLEFDPTLWGQRRVHRTSASIGRADAQELLRQLGATGPGRLMAAESFEISVLSRDAGLFTTPKNDDKGLSLAIEGMLYFPMAGGQ